MSQRLLNIYYPLPKQDTMGPDMPAELRHPLLGGCVAHPLTGTNLPSNHIAGTEGLAKPLLLNIMGFTNLLGRWEKMWHFTSPTAGEAINKETLGSYAGSICGFLWACVSGAPER